MEFEMLMTPMTQIALIIGLAEVAKKIGLNKRWIPLVDLGIGLMSGIFIYHFVFDNGVIESIVIGIALGLSACGLFSGFKNLAGK